MKLLELLCIIVIAIILCKVIAFSVILLFMWMKGKSFNFDSKQWDTWFLKTNEKKIFWMFTGVYFLSAAVSSFVIYGLLVYFDFQYAMEITVAFFGVRMVITGLHYYKSGKKHICDLLIQIHKTVLKSK